MVSVDYPSLIVSRKNKKCCFEACNKPPVMSFINVQDVWSYFARF
jgi:hypothetical protein